MGLFLHPVFRKNVSLLVAIRKTVCGSISLPAFSSLALNYSFIDGSPLTGLNFYRLNQTDLDGGHKHSIALKIDFKSTGSLRIYPNPVVNDVLYIEGISSKSQITISNLNGQVLIAETAGNNNLKTVNVRKLPPGIYILNVVDEKGARTQRKIVKQ